MTSGARGAAAGALALVALAMGGGVAQAQGPVLENGKTKAVYDYTKAIREKVFIPQPGIDQDRANGDDWIRIDIIRPSEGSAGNKMPAIIDPSPYYTTLCRGADTQCMSDWDNDGVNDRWPLFYDNYFLPRGYAYILAQMNGTGYNTTGCPMHGGPGDIAGEKSVIDWLNGRVKGYSAPDLTSAEKLADWHNGSSAMIGKSYDGTLANGVAATGVEGLKTIVPISAISAWYNYSRVGGVRFTNNYPGGSLNPTVTYPGTPPAFHVIDLPNQLPDCTAVNSDISDDDKVDTGDGDAHGDINTFWRDRDYNLNVNKVKAAVFATHGIQDDNVRTDQIGMWWEGLKANNVPRKLWLLRAGHEDPFDSHRDVWVDTLHRWFDHWLYGVNNNIMSEPAVTVEDEKDVWGDYADWPIPGTQNVDVFLRATDNPAAAGTLGGMTGGALDTLPFSGSNATREDNVNGVTANLLNSVTGQQGNRRVFISRPLTDDVRFSGTASADLTAGINAACVVSRTVASKIYYRCPDVSVLVADVGAGQQVSRNSDGVRQLATQRCWGVGAPGNVCEGKAQGEICSVTEGSAASRIENACYRDPDKPLDDVTIWRVTRGIRDTQNRDSLWFADAAPFPAADPNAKFRLRFPTFPTEHTFKAGHQIAVIVAGINGSMVSGNGEPNNFPVALDTRISKVTLPIKGGYSALAGAGGTDAETVAPVLAAVPNDILIGTTDATGTTVTYTNPTATDNEDPNPDVTCDPASRSKFAVGTTTVTCVAKDANGNTSEAKTFKVVVRRDVPVNSPVSGTVPATLSLTLGAAPNFGGLTPGVTRTYLAQTSATVTSTAGDALLSVADPSPNATGHLVNGTFSLPQPLQARARNAGNPSPPTPAYNNVGSSASPLNLLAWSAPTSSDALSLEFSQLVNANDALRTGTYAKSLTFTLSTTTP